MAGTVDCLRAGNEKLAKILEGAYDPTRPTPSEMHEFLTPYKKFDLGYRTGNYSLMKIALSEGARPGYPTYDLTGLTEKARKHGDGRMLVLLAKLRS